MVRRVSRFSSVALAMGVSVLTRALMCERYACISAVGCGNPITCRLVAATMPLIPPKNGWHAGSPIGLPMSPWPVEGDNANATGAAVASAGTRRS
jgi:hypothetical protein